MQATGNCINHTNICDLIANYGRLILLQKRHVSRTIVPRAIFANCCRVRRYVLFIYFLIVFLDFNAVIPDDGIVTILYSKNRKISAAVILLIYVVNLFFNTLVVGISTVN